MSQAHAIRSTPTCSQVTHFMSIPSFLDLAILMHGLMHGLMRGGKRLAQSGAQRRVEVVVLLELLVAPGERGQVRARTLQFDRKLAISPIYLLHELPYEVVILGVQAWVRVPDLCAALHLHNLGGQPLQLLARVGCRREHPDRVVQQQRAPALELAPDEDSAGAGLWRNLVHQ